MAVGSGDAFSLPATLLTVILLWSFFQWSAPLWLPGLAEKNPDKAKFYAGIIGLASLVIIAISWEDFQREMIVSAILTSVSTWSYIRSAQMKS